MRGSKYELPEKSFLLTRGLSLLMQHEQCRYFKHLDNCGEYCLRKAEHPFDLDLPELEEWQKPIKIVFTGAHATDMSVEVFLANIRFWVGCSEGCIVNQLRVINVPVPERTPGHHYVYFELWVGSHVFISGETTNCSGAGNEARTQLEGVFAVLSQVYNLEIKRITLPKVIQPDELYQEEVC